MHMFRVWAPKAKSVKVKVASKKHTLEAEAEDGDWWAATVENAGPGTDYCFLLNGDDQERPDPRSQFQPEGVNGPSRIIDHAAFAWTDGGFHAKAAQSAIVYELHMGTFTREGTCEAALGKLEYLRELGITHIELLPFAAFPGVHGWGYDGVDLFAPHAPYGSPDNLKRFVDAAHGKGMGVIMDVVYNHFGPAGNILGMFGTYFTDQHKTPWGDAVNLEDAGSFEVRRFFCDNALMWLRDYHMDGLRLDAVHAYMDRSAIPFMEQINAEVDTLQAETGRSYLMIAESDLNDPRLVRSRDAYGYGFDAQWSDDFHHALVALLTEDTSGYYEDFGSFADLAQALSATFVFDGQFSTFRNRNHGRPASGLPGWKFFGYAQNHDQVGNRANGERFVHLTDIVRAKIAAAVTLLSPFLPMIFQGEEWAASSPFLYFTDHQDEELARLVSEGRKREFAAFGWKPEDVPDPQDQKTFERSKLKWNEITDVPHAEMLDWYKKLIALRQSRGELSDGAVDQVEIDFDEEHRWLTMQRGSTVLIFTLDENGYEAGVAMNVSLLLASGPGVQLKDQRLKMPGVGVAILAVQ
jgi:maltooligosyltrehalose trehalohydrolase